MLDELFYDFSSMNFLRKVYMLFHYTYIYPYNVLHFNKKLNERFKLLHYISVS